MGIRFSFPRALLLLALVPAGANAQAYSVEELSRYDAPTSLPGWQGEVALVGANAVLGGVVTGVVRELRGGSFLQGFAAGAAGSVVAYSGRRLSVADVPAAGFVSRQLNAVGASMVRNGAAGRPALSRVVLPLGPARLYLDRTAPGRTTARVKLNAHELFWLARGTLDPTLSLRWGATLSAGAPVFQRTNGRLSVDGHEVNGYQAGGAIFLSGEAGLGQHWTLPHERVHVLQGDFLAIAWLDPAEGWLMQHSGATRAIHRLFDLGLLDVALRTALARGFRLRSVNGAQELEAELLESR